MTRVYYREAVGALMVFDVTRASTFDAVLKWKDDLDSKVRRPRPTIKKKWTWNPENSRISILLLIIVIYNHSDTFIH